MAYANKHAKEKNTMFSAKYYAVLLKYDRILKYYVS